MKRILQCFVPLIIFFLTTRCHDALELVTDITPAGEITNLAIEKLDVDVKFTWTDPTDIDLKAIRLTIFNADNQQKVRFADVLPDSLEYTFESLQPGNFYVKVQTRDKENQLSEGVTLPFIYLSKSPTNVKNVQSAVYWNVLHLDWDTLTTEDYTSVVEGQQLVEPVDSIVVVVDNKDKIQLPATATGTVIPDLSDGYHSVKIYTKGHSGYYSGKFQYTTDNIRFGEKFVRVQGNGFDFYIARYEVTTEEYRKFVMEDLAIAPAQYGPYHVDKQKVEADAWYKWWYGNDPVENGIMYLVGFSTWEFVLSSSDGWLIRPTIAWEPNGAFGKITWEGAMLYSLINYNGRCPTQEEWLYAAKGGPLSHNYDYAGGNDPDAVGWFYYTENVRPFQHQVGIKLPNELGIYDMSGNVGEILYELDNNGGASLGNTIIAGGSSGPQIHFWGREPEIFDILKPKLTDPEVIKHTGLKSNSGLFAMGCRVLIPHSEIVKLPFNRHKYEL